MLIAFLIAFLVVPAASSTASPAFEPPSRFAHGGDSVRVRSDSSAQERWLERRAPSSVALRKDRKSRWRAFVYSFGATVVPVAAGLALGSRGRVANEDLGLSLSGAGLIVGPAVGHWYADDHDQARRGMLVRLGATTVFAVGAVTVGFDLLGDDELSPGGNVGVALAIGGMAALAGSIVYDVATAPQSATQYNDTRDDGRVSVAPHVDPVRDQYGLAVRVQM